MPSWAKDEAIGSRLFNARAETVADKPSFRAAYRKRRCIVPVNGFYEWKAVAGGTEPYYIHAADEQLLGLAGLWEHWHRPDDGARIDTFTILTTDANAIMKPLHARMPVILAPATYAAWLAPEGDPVALQARLSPCADDVIALHPVGKAVGNVRNEGAGLIDPK